MPTPMRDGIPRRGRVLVVCTANVCRSPLAGTLLRVASSTVGGQDLDVDEAGTRAVDGRPAARSTVDLARDWGVDLGDHRARRLRAAQVVAADLVLTMERAHQVDVLGVHPEALARTFTWREFARLATVVDVPGGPADGPATATDVARSAHRARPVAGPPRASDDIPDPFGQPASAYRRMAQSLVDAATEFLPLLGLHLPPRWEHVDDAPDACPPT